VNSALSFSATGRRSAVNILLWLFGCGVVSGALCYKESVLPGRRTITLPGSAAKNALKGFLVGFFMPPLGLLMGLWIRFR
jgi:hypothetical protein